MMKGVTTSLMLALAVLLTTSQVACKEKKHTGSLLETSTKSTCRAWDQIYARLSDNEKGLLLKDGAVRAAGALVLSTALISDCNLRTQMSAYFGRRLSDENGNGDDRKFAASHSREIVEALRHIWPSLSDSKALIGDGNFNSEKYDLLDDPALESSVVAPLISDIMEKEGISSAVTFVIFSRPMPELKISISHQRKEAERTGDILGQIYGLALLQKIGDPQALFMLRELSKKRTLSNFESKCLRKLIAKVERGEPVIFADVEDLEYLNDR